MLFLLLDKLRLLVSFFFPLNVIPLERIQMWEMRMIQLGAISGNMERLALQKNGAPTPVHDLNVPYEGPTEEYETPTAEMLFPPVRWLPCVFGI